MSKPIIPMLRPEGRAVVALLSSRGACHCRGGYLILQHRQIHCYEQSVDDEDSQRR